VAQKVEPGAAVHLPHDPLRTGVDAFGPAVAVREGEGGVHGVAVEFQAVGEAVQVRQISGTDGGDPAGELGVVAVGWGEELGEAADVAGEFGSSSRRL
jgi:hypothetical protein